MKIKTASEGVIDHKHDVESFFFFQYRKFFPKVFPCKSFFPLEISLQDICFLKSPISPPPSKVKWYESWV